MKGKTALPNVCHPERASAGKRRRRRVYSALLAVVAATGLWPIPLTQGSAPTEFMPPRPVVSLPPPPVYAPDVRKLRIRAINAWLKGFFEKEQVNDQNLLSLDSEPYYRAAFFIAPASRSGGLRQALEREMAAFPNSASEVKLHLAQPMPNLLVFSIAVDNDLSHELTFYFPDGGKERPQATFRPRAPQLRPKIAIVIDDLGDHWEKFQELNRVDAPLTLSFLPDTPFAEAGARVARKSGKEVFLHLPMEPEDGGEINAPDFLLTRDDELQLASRVQKLLEHVPGAVGVNNHMGSRFTRDRDRMSTVLRVLQARKLLFLDSRTTDQTVGFAVAHELGMRSGMRDVFLDHNPSPKAIERQFKKLRQIARHKGQAIAIGHPFQATIAALAREVKDLKRAGFEIVPASALMR